MNSIQRLTKGMKRSRHRNIRVLHVGPGYGQKGGIATVLNDLRSKADNLQSLGIKTAIFPTRSFKSATNILKFVSTDILRFIHAAWHADIVHLHVASRGSLVRKGVIFATAKVMRRRCIFHVHSGDFFEYYEGAGAVYRAAAKCMVRHSDARVVVSSAHRDDMLKTFGTTSLPTVIGNCAVEAERACLSCAQPIDDGRYVLFAARLAESKGLEELFRAVRELRLRGLCVPLKVAGSGDTARWRGLAETLGIEDQVEFIGWIVGESKIAAFARASIFCMPSYFESFGISTLEAMWAGRPVIGTVVGGFSDLVQEGETGYLVPPRNIPLLAERIGELWSNAARANGMGKAGKRAAQKKFGSAVIIDKYATLYRTVCH
ncbi:glycosyltransferase family 4 protein [Paraburkholderia tuberum]|uniref:Glycosyltransferase involved in cell wall bisynthesis n=1 Tax=Paraburkholderia tuberum TaxID=157910 RepID=A0A1H1KL89_9BURK|nr:glycosyltransferase family 4 protein [Paraburkholderia tuberum]SDR63063.1 Glycosyltransferase involved in cell wall bisynthesis [Paraburkholderia tuberum]